MTKPGDVLPQAVNDEAVRVHALLWHSMGEHALRQATFDDQNSACALALAFRELIPCENPTRGYVQIIAGHKRYLAMGILGVMGALSAKALNTLRTPVAVGEVVDPVPVNLLLRGCYRPGDFLARSRLFLRRLDLARLFACRGRRARGAAALCW